jgi:hypothetical protein
MSNPIADFPASNSVYISDPTGLPVLGQSPFGVYGIQDWMYPAQYQSKVTFDDEMNFTVHIQGDTTGLQNGDAKLYLLDYYDPINGTYKIAGTNIYIPVGASNYYTPTVGAIDLNVAPYFKGKQQIAGNYYNNPLSTDNGTPLKTFMWSFSFSDLSISTAGTYYLMLVNRLHLDEPNTNTYTPYFSEPMMVQASWKKTLLFQSTFNTNKSDNWNIVVTGWFNDYPANTQTYTPIFQNRCEGYVIDYDPKAVQVSYLQQSYQALQTFGKWVRMKTLKIGELERGIPPHILEAISAQILADTYYINGYPYINFNTSNSTQLGDMWKSRRPNDAYPLIYASTMIMEKYQGQGAIVTPPPPVPTRYFDPASFSPGFA